jgi:hypothetical protein
MDFILRTVGILLLKIFPDLDGTNENKPQYPQGGNFFISRSDHGRVHGSSNRSGRSRKE